MKILVSRDGEQAGPFTMEELKQRLKNRQVSLDDHAWWEGEAQWVPLKLIRELRDSEIDPTRPIELTEADLVPAESISLWRPRVPFWLEITAFFIVAGTAVGLVAPIFQTLNWLKLRNFEEVRRSFIWLVALLATYVALSGFVSQDRHRYAVFAFWFWLVAIVAWHEIQGRKQVKFTKSRPLGTTRYRSLKSPAVVVILVQTCLLVVGYFHYQKQVIEVSARQVINQSLIHSDLGKFECVQVRLGDLIADRLYRGEAVIDTGELIPITVRISTEPASIQRAKSTIFGYLGWEAISTLDDQISVRLNGRELLASPAALDLMK